MILIATIFVLVTGGAYLLLQRFMVHAVFGLRLLSHAVNFVLLTADTPGWWAEPTTDGTSMVTAAGPLSQAFVLTVIVIALVTSILMFAMAVIGRNDSMLHHPKTEETRRA